MFQTKGVLPTLENRISQGEKIKRQILKTFSFEMQNSKSWSNNFLKHLQLLFPLVLEGHKKKQKN